jgi:Spy/CpxP family protein refolding chaperone
MAQRKAVTIVAVGSGNLSPIFQKDRSMRQKTPGRLAFRIALVSLGLLLVTVEQPVLRADGAAKSPGAKRGRHVVPKYYGKIVTEEQREKIYKIQDAYDPKIDALTAQLKALKAERDEKIRGVLTPEQQKQVDEAAAKAKKKSAK